VNGLTSANEAITQEIELLNGYIRRLGFEPPEFNGERDGEMLSGSDEQSSHGHGFGIGVAAPIPASGTFYLLSSASTR
jgi:hypothetical protein